MKFGYQFEFSKVPEWYSDYLDYIALRNRIDDLKKLVKEENAKKLEGDWKLNVDGATELVDYNIL